MRLPLSPRQGDALEAIRTYSVVNGYPPAIKNVANLLKVSQPTAQQLITALAKKGYVQREPGVARSLRIID